MEDRKAYNPTSYKALILFIVLKRLIFVCLWVYNG